jgi:hypothetical protein
VLAGLISRCMHSDPKLRITAELLVELEAFTCPSPAVFNEVSRSTGGEERGAALQPQKRASTTSFAPQKAPPSLLVPVASSSGSGVASPDSFEGNNPLQSDMLDIWQVSGPLQHMI